MTLVVDFSTSSTYVPPANPWVIINFVSDTIPETWALFSVGTTTKGVVELEWFLVDSLSEIIVPGESTVPGAQPPYELIPTQDHVP